VGHLGTPQLTGQGIVALVLQTAVGRFVTEVMSRFLGSIQEPLHHGAMTTFKRLLRRFDAYTLEVFNPPIHRRVR
jgi:hypothetical protein